MIAPFRSTEYTFRGETYTRTKIDGRRHNSACEHCGHAVHRRVSDFTCGRKVLHTHCVAKGCPAPVTVHDDGRCAGCRCLLPASVAAAVYGGLRYCTHACRHNVVVAQSHGVAP